MYTVRVTFDEVLHVHRNSASLTSPKHTVFSFMSNYQYTPYVTVPGFPELRPGMKVVALLRKENDWKSLVGWRNLETNEVAAPDERQRLISLLMSSVLTVFVVMAFGGNFLRDPAANVWPLALFFSLWLAVFIVEYREWQQARAEVKSVNALAAGA
jgi:hypothetical protein